MRSRPFSAWQKLMALAPLLLMAVYLPGSIMLRCRADGLLRASCCCPGEQPGEQSGDGQLDDAVATAVVRPDGCCDREITAGARPIVATARGLEHDLSWPAASVAIVRMAPAAPPSPAGAVFASAWQRRGPPGDGPPIVLVKQSFLI